MDAFGVVGVEKDEQDAAVEAVKWFHDDYDDVRLLFEYAGVDPEPIVAALGEKHGW